MSAPVCRLFPKNDFHLANQLICDIINSVMKNGCVCGGRCSTSGPRGLWRRLMCLWLQHTRHRRIVNAHR